MDATRDTIVHCERVAHADGLAAGLATALAGVDTARPPGPVAALPAGRVAAGTPVIRHELAASEGVSFVRRADPPPDPADPAGLTSFGARLGAVRLGVTRRLTEQATAHVAGRTAEGEPLIRKQLVAAVLADALTAIETLRHCLLTAGRQQAAVADVHQRLTDLDWELTKLLGASGFLADSPARAAYVSRLTANCWALPGTAS